jgi:hypothetical protein
MAAEEAFVIVLQDPSGALYAVPGTVIAQYRVPEEQLAEVTHQLAAPRDEVSSYGLGDALLQVQGAGGFGESLQLQGPGIAGNGARACRQSGSREPDSVLVVMSPAGWPVSGAAPGHPLLSSRRQGARSMINVS